MDTSFHHTRIVRDILKSSPSRTSRESAGHRMLPPHRPPLKRPRVLKHSPGQAIWIVHTSISCLEWPKMKAMMQRYAMHVGSVGSKQIPFPVTKAQGLRPSRPRLHRRIRCTIAHAKVPAKCSVLMRSRLCGCQAARCKRVQTV